MTEDRAPAAFEPADDGLHTGVMSDKWWETETAWFSFHHPERRLGGWLYTMVRPNIGTVAGGAWVWDDTAWLPWDVLETHENPYEAASELADLWCGVALTSLALADVMSFTLPGGSWELAVIFRAELSAAPLGDAERRPFIYTPRQYDAIGSFDPVDLERWVSRSGDTPAPTAASQADTPGLLF